MKCSGGRISPSVASSSPLVTTARSSFQLHSLSNQHCYTHSLISTNTLKSESKLCMFTSRQFFIKTSNFSSSEDTPKLNRCVVIARSNLNFPLISPDDHWGTWTAVFATGAFGLWSERTKIGRKMCAPIVSILLGLITSNMGIIPHEAHTYYIVMNFLLPLTIPLMLFTADMRNVIETTGKLLLAFLIGSVATIIGTLVAFLIVPMLSLRQNNWKIASALMASHIGGGVNYVAVSDALGVSRSVFAAGVAAEKVICAIYFIVLFALGSKLPSEASPSTDYPEHNLESISTIQTAIALAVSFTICKVARHITPLLKLQSGILPAITAIFMILATLLPRQIGYLKPTGDAFAATSIQVFFVVLGASGSIWNVIKVAPSVFVFAFIQVTVHLIVILQLGKLLHLDLKLLLLASNANIGGPTSASWMATANGWGSLVIPGILVGIFGNFIATKLVYSFGSSLVGMMDLFMLMFRWF